MPAPTAAFQNFVGSLAGKPAVSPTLQPTTFGAPTAPATPLGATPASPSATAAPSAPAQSTVAPARSAYTASLSQPQGLTAAQVTSNLNAYNSANPSSPTAPSTPGSAATTPVAGASTSGTTSSTDPSTTPGYVAAYQKALAAYTASLAPSSDTTAAATTLADVQGQIDAATNAENQSVQTTLDTPGMLKAGAQDAATQLQRRDNANIANLSVTEGADARTLTALQGRDSAAQTAAGAALTAAKPLQVGDTYIDTTTGQVIPNTAAADTAGFTLSAGQTRYDAAGNPIATAASDTSGTVPVTDTNGTTTNVPLSVAPYYNTTDSGVSYMDASDIQGTAADKAQAIADAQKAGITVVTNKNEAADLTNITDANSNLDTVDTIMAGIDQPDALSRALYGLGLTSLASVAQTNPQQAAAGALQSMGLDVLKAISGIQGFRGNASVIQQVTDHLPSIYDTQATIDSKIAFIKDLISNRENAILGIKAPAAANTGQTVTVAAPDGTQYQFSSQKAADAFQTAIGGGSNS